MTALAEPLRGALPSEPLLRPWQSPAPDPDPADPNPFVLVTGSTGYNFPGEVRSALTEAWRRVGRPICVATEQLDRSDVVSVAEAWAREHAWVGCTYDTRLAWPWRTGVLVLAFGCLDGHVTRRMVEMAEQAGTMIVAFPEVDR